MTPRTLLTAELFVGPRRAAEIVGEELFADRWRDEFLEEPDRTEFGEVLAILRQVLRAGEVAATWSSFDFHQSGDLRPQDADHEFFTIDVRSDVVFHAGVNQPVKCSIHSVQLRRFLRGQQSQRVTPTQLDEKRCFDWLVLMFQDRDEEIPVTAVLKAKAKAKFARLSDRGFKAAKKRAIEKTGRTELSRPGRRKNSIR